VSAASDVLGNRLTKGSSVSYEWDALNRMTSYTSGSVTTSYVYRADGMRVSKSDSTGSAVYRYDGQMAVQDVETTSTGTIVNDYALGARGIDAVSKTENGSTTVGYPLLYGSRRPLVKQRWRRVEETPTASTRPYSEIAGRRVSPPARA
jgi:YD repeat-containing protein